MHPERFPLGTLKKFHTRRMGLYKVLRRFDSSAYGLDILHDFGVSPVFSVENLTRYRTSMMSQRLTVRPLQSSLLNRPTTEELVQSLPVQFHHPCHRHSPVVNFSKPKIIDGNH